jgi:hypothetical protein
MSTTTSNSQNVTLTASTASALHWAEWFDYLVVTNLDASAVVWATTDGSAASVSETGAIAIPPSSTVTIANRQAKPAWYTPGENMTSSTGVTSQDNENGVNLPASGYGTYVSLISSGTPQVVVSPQ